MGGVYERTEEKRNIYGVLLERIKYEDVEWIDHTQERD